MRARAAIRARYSFVALAVLTLLLSGANLLFTTHQVAGNNRQWCDTLRLLTSKPITKPVNPAENPARVQTYTLYMDFVTLRHRLGC